MNPDVACGVALMAGVTDLAPATLEAWLAALPRCQRQRAVRFRSLRRCRQFVAARYLLQALIREGTGMAAKVVASDSGAPGIEGGGLHCSIAHSADMVMVAYSRQGPVGVDVEHTRNRDWMKLVQAWFPAVDGAHCERLPEAEGQYWFYRQWTVREAIAKAEGAGLLLASLRRPLSALGSWRLTELDLPGYQGAIAHGGAIWPRVRVADRDVGGEELRLIPLSHTKLDYRVACYENGQQP